jgi:hypothetical protein
VCTAALCCRSWASAPGACLPFVSWAPSLQSSSGYAQSCECLASTFGTHILLQLLVPLLRTGTHLLLSFSGWLQLKKTVSLWSSACGCMLSLPSKHAWRLVRFVHCHSSPPADITHPGYTCVDTAALATLMSLESRLWATSQKVTAVKAPSRLLLTGTWHHEHPAWRFPQTIGHQAVDLLTPTQWQPKHMAAVLLHSFILA